MEVFSLAQVVITPISAILRIATGSQSVTVQKLLATVQNCPNTAAVLFCSTQSSMVSPTHATPISATHTCSKYGAYYTQVPILVVWRTPEGTVPIQLLKYSLRPPLLQQPFD